MREISDRYGFGRIHVKAVPAAKAEYVAKYLGKPQKELPKGMRRWAAHGFDGVKASEVHIEKKEFDSVTPCYKPAGLWDGWGFVHEDGSQFLCITRHDAPQSPRNIIMYDLKPLATKEVLNLAASGKFVSVGEYRGFSIVEKNIWNDKTRANESRLLVEHTIEFGTNSVKSTEWLPPGSKREGVKSPANKGDLVLVSVTQISRQYGITCESIRPVATLAI